jgi:hypothetical protein
MKVPKTVFTIAFVAAAAFAQAEKPKRADAAKPTPAAATPKPAEVAPAAASKPAPVPNGASDVPAKMADDFFALLQKGQIDEAYANLTQGSKTIEKPEDLRVLKQKTKEAIEVFGAIIGYELVETKPVGTRLLRRTYLSLGADSPLRWRFYFYHANDRWRLIDLRVDDRLAGMFDETPEAANENKPAAP